MDEFLIFFYYLLIFLSLVMGGIYKFYYRIGCFDLFVHFISGFFTSIVAFILLDKNKLINKKYKWFGFLFIILFTVSIAVLWEYLEFFCDKLFGCDTQWVFESGVDDTMTDMLIATLSGILSSCYYLYYLNTIKIHTSLFFKQTFQQFSKAREHSNAILFIFVVNYFGFIIVSQINILTIKLT